MEEAGHHLGDRPPEQAPGDGSVHGEGEEDHLVDRAHVTCTRGKPARAGGVCADDKYPERGRDIE